MARIFLERRDMGEDLRRLLELLGDDAAAATAGECTPPVDVVETRDALEIIMDVAGVPADAMQIVLTRGTVVIGGRKLPPSCEHHEAAFHLVERSFGRFARAVRLAGAFDGGRAEATLAAGELRIVLPRIEERRGGEIRIPIRTAELRTPQSD